MSVSGKRGVGIPVILLHDAEGGIVTIELKNGFVYRGILDEAQDNMNCTMKVSLAPSPIRRMTNSCWISSRLEKNEDEGVYLAACNRCRCDFG
jgi:small nuclear ribonucleoprotein (snRNP)-like protein